MNQNKNGTKDNKKYILMSICSVLVFLFIWELVTDVLGIFKSTMLPSPVKVFGTFIDKFTNTKPDGATIQVHTLASLKVALSGYLIGVGIGVPLGIAMAWFRKVDCFVTPLFDLLRPVPGIAWLPVLIVFFGIGLLSKAMVIFLSAFIACVINSYSGIKNTRMVHLWVGQTFGATRSQLLFKVAIPTALPMIFTGLKVALGASWNALIAAELLASTKGLGFMINQARGIYRPDIILVGMIAVGITGAILGYLIELLQKLVMKRGWRQ
ncbi:MAG: ABC transporter permease [Lachnospiraceae bacterium]|jgi:ABC-type nitrate/sulfonate/bicarbonate transport system permease component|nr:ABC transporter permease [Lachnospiraceae bacterium]